MIARICRTCGVQHAESAAPPERCAVCDDERQYIGWEGQQWTTLAELRAAHHNVLRDEPPEPGGASGLTGIVTEPTFAIGQRALHVRDPAFPLLWDCVSLVDDATVEALAAAGGVRAVAISHPHYYATLVDWSRALGGVPVYLHAEDRAWAMRPDPAIVFWEGETLALANGLTLVRCGGHFPGGTVLHWAAGAGGRGVLLTGDIVAVNQDRRTVTFMYSYPNYIPVGPAAVRRIAAAIEPFAFERIYGAFRGREILSGAKDAVRYSAARYLRAIGAG